MSGNDHFTCLQKLCRVCGERRSKGRPYHCNVFSEQILEKLNLDVSKDLPTVHPKYLCFSCQAYLISEEDKNTKEVEIKHFPEHAENSPCWVCDTEVQAAATKSNKRKRANTSKSPPPKAIKDCSIKVKDLNDVLQCGICNGYFVDPVTITECLHTFCKSCIVQHLHTRHTCPVCKSVVHDTNPLLNIRCDKLYKDIIDKVLPSLSQSEKERKEEFYKNRDKLKNDADGSNAELKEDNNFPPNDGKSYFHANDIKISLCLEPESNEKLLRPMPMKYIRCSIRLKVNGLIKFIQEKTMQGVDMGIICNKQDLNPEETLEKIWLDTWKVKEAPMRLYYKKRC